MRFGITATSLMCPKNLRTRLRPVNVCCAIVASHFVALAGEPSEARLASPPGLYPDNPVPCHDLRVLILSLSCELQNAKRRAKQGSASPVSTIRVTDRKSPKFAYLPTACAETSPSPLPNRVFVLPSRYGMAIVEIRGDRK